MLFPKYALKDLPVGGGSRIGRDNIKEFFNYVSKHEDIEDRSLAEFAPTYVFSAIALVHMLEAKFVNLNPIMQQMFLNLHKVEDIEKRDFILETLLREFGDIATEARKVFDRFKMLGSCVDVVSILEKLDKDKTSNEDEFEISIPSKLEGLDEALEKNFDWIIPANPFDENSEPRSDERGSSEPYIDKIQCIVEKVSVIDLNAPSLEST